LLSDRLQPVPGDVGLIFADDLHQSEGVGIVKRHTTIDEAVQRDAKGPDIDSAVDEGSLRINLCTAELRSIESWGTNCLCQFNSFVNLLIIRLGMFAIAFVCLLPS
jgi:hypothetical protein